LWFEWANLAADALPLGVGPRRADVMRGHHAVRLPEPILSRARDGLRAVVGPRRAGRAAPAVAPPPGLELFGVCTGRSSST
jgi:hypothetical protein